MLVKIGIMVLVAIGFYISVTAAMRLMFRKSLVTHLWTMMAPGVIFTAFLAGLAGKLSETGASPWITRGGIPAIALVILVISFILVARKLTSPLQKAVDAIDEGSMRIQEASSQISSSSHTLSSGASEQAASIEETSSSLEEMSSMTRQNAANAGQANQIMQETNTRVGQANTAMEKLTRSMEAISLASEETSKIIKTIDEIAFQTNLLALNAAVEAARAGEAGAGFAVVADEVRNLALRAAEASRNTASLIEGTVTRVGDGVDLVTRTSEAFAAVSANSEKIGGLIGEIAGASSEQAQGVGQINAAVSEMSAVTQQNAAIAEESASASEEIHAEIKAMQAEIEGLVALVDNGQKQHRPQASLPGAALTGRPAREDHSCQDVPI